MIGKDFGQVTKLQYENRALARKVKAFQSGAQYIKMEKEYNTLLRFHNQEIKRYKVSDE